MALTVNPKLTTLSTADAATGWNQAKGALDTEVYIQGGGTPASYSWQAGKNSRTTCTYTPASAVNMTTSYTNPHVYFWMRCDVFPFSEDLQTGAAATSGLMMRMTDTSGNYREWHVAGADTWGGEWKCFVIDPSNTTSNDVYASSGTLDLTAINLFSFYLDISNSGTIRIINNTWNDVLRYGEGLEAIGTDFDITDVATNDNLLANKYGVLENIDGVILCQGQLTIGDNSTTTTFTSDNEVLVFRDRTSGGGLGLVKSGFYKFLLNGTGVTADISALTLRGAGTTDSTRFILDADDTNITMDFAGCSVTRASTVGFAAGDSVKNSSFNDCGQIDPSTSTFQNNTISNYVGTSGSMIFPTDDANLKNLIFLNCDNGILYNSSSDALSPKFDNFQFDDIGGNYDVNNTSGGSITIAMNNGSNANSYNSGGSVVTFSSAAVTTQITVKDASDLSLIDNARVFLKVSDDTGPLPFEESITLSYSTTTATAAHTAHGLTTGQWVLIANATDSLYNGMFTITLVDVNTYTYTMTGTPSAGDTGDATAIIFNTLTSSGIVSDSRSLSSSQPVSGRVRRSSTTPLYKTSKITGTINNTTGFTNTTLLIIDE